MASISDFTSQPGKFIFTLRAIVINVIKFPFWILYFIPPFLRPNPKWTYQQALGVRILKSYLAYVSTIEIKTPIDLRPGAEGDRFVTIKPGNPDNYIGVVAQDRGIIPQTIGGTWYPAHPSLSSDVGKVALHFHGGAYVIGNGRTQDVGFAARTILANTMVTHVFAPQYRLASNPGGRFPAFLQDAITSLLYLSEELGIPAKHIAISGDSAGAHLCLTLLRYIADNPEAKLAAPACAWLWSPWGNPAAALEQGSIGKNQNEPTDYLVEQFGVWGAKSMKPSEASGITLEHPSICILGNAFATPTPLLFIAGGSEVLYDDILEMYEEFKVVKGNKVGLEVVKEAVHDIILTGYCVRFINEARLAAKHADEFWINNEQHS
ncbi:hypothetical protein OIDMADRAFT_108499 [Oidiodendron maius Zn]|uniref:Alpha/beta hydrolase fold-3 domain-containing protein n=1 Tax=Oidiodendron maius (strain Zn) TaxID=913774 RepID=A0A0C3HF03_OIDMZ|nr:hypothetical protein OIDMADRAFT_108499 [Oidiodendron maius Zn]